MKYVMFTKNLDGMAIAYPVIFPNDLVHDEVAEALMAGPLQGYTVRSAGEVSSVGIGNNVGGRSTTLNVSAHPDDKDIINGIDYGSCFI